MPLLTEISWSEVPTMLFFTGLFDSASQLMATLRPSVGGAKRHQSSENIAFWQEWQESRLMAPS
jgi:hypothetical protein